MKQYLLDVILVPHNVADLLYIVFCVSAPPFGVLFGGVFVQEKGGYEHINAMYFVLFNTFACTILAFLFAFIKNVYCFSVLMWIYLFFGSSIVPCLGGSILSALPLDLKGSGNSLMNILVNLLGNTPAPYIYGFIYEKSKTFMPTLAFSSCLGVAFFGLLGVIWIIKIRKDEETASNKKDECELNANPKINNNSDIMSQNNHSIN